jgi:hypothetical protein
MKSVFLLTFATENQWLLELNVHLTNLHVCVDGLQLLSEFFDFSGFTV